MTAVDWAHDFLAGAPTQDLFSPDALWRDYLGMGWDLVTHDGMTAIDAAREKAFRATVSTAPIAHSNTEAIFTFDGPHGPVKALVECREGKAIRLFTSLEEPAPWSDDGFDPTAAPPQVVILGGGQSGLALGARLHALRVPYLIIEKNLRVGDNWRGRYDSLILHDPTWVNHLPYKRFPKDWPTFTPKDRMGDWLEDYARALSLNVASGTTLTHAARDKDAGAWTLLLQKQDGSSRTITAPELVFAVGTSGFAHQPKFPGQDRFEGPQLHSSAYRSGAAFEGKSVAIVGATNSAHDIAVDLVKAGARPTMIQRSSTHVIPHAVYINDILAPVWGEHLDRPIEHSDFLSLSLPMRRLEQRGIDIFTRVQDDWRDFYGALSKAGMALDFAEDGAGILGKYRRTASGYYIDVGGSKRVCEGEIGLRSGVGVASLEARSIVLTDGSILPADAVVYATGFGSMEQWVSALVDVETAQAVGPCWGYGSGVPGDPGPWDGELRNMWKPTAQRGLWFMGGNLAQVRAMSRYLALQLRRSAQQRAGG